jgi:phage-related protein
MGYALYVAQRGGKHRDTKTLSGFGGAGVVEVIKDFRGDTFRTVYTMRYEGAVYVLHAFQKKSKTGRETPRGDVELFGVRQPDISMMLRGEFRQFSVERLLRFLVALNQDVEIVVKPHRDRSNAPALHVS